MKASDQTTGRSPSVRQSRATVLRWFHRRTDEPERRDARAATSEDAEGAATICQVRHGIRRRSAYEPPDNQGPFPAPSRGPPLAIVRDYRRNANLAVVGFWMACRRSRSTKSRSSAKLRRKLGQAGALVVPTFATMWLIRVPREEAMMRTAFGEAYDIYCGRTGRLFNLDGAMFVHRP